MASGISEITRINFNTDMFNELEQPVIYVARKNKEILETISVYENLSLEFNLNAFDTISFDVYEKIDNIEQSYYEKLEDGRLILVQGAGWFEIHVSENNDDGSWVKNITGNSLESILCQRYLVDFECNAGEILYDDYVKTIFYDPINPKGSLLHRVLDIVPNWSIGHVDDVLWNKQRTFDIDKQDVYSFLTSEVSEAFDCLFIFDTYNMTVNAYNLENYGNDTGIHISEENFADSISVTTEENSIITCLRVYGGDGININEVNPNGTNKIYDFSYYLDEMSISLARKVRLYNETYDGYMEQYEDIMERMSSCVDIILELENRVPESFSSTDWSTYGLTLLKSKQKLFQTQDEVYKSLEMDVKGSTSYDAYVQNSNYLSQVNTEIITRENEIANQNIIYESIKKERDSLQSDLDMDKWFTEEEWKELDCYIKEDTYENDNFIVTDQENDFERLDITRQLFEKAKKDLNKWCRPQYQYSTTLNNLLSIPEFKELKRQFARGNFIYLNTNHNKVVKLRMISFKVDFSNLDSIDVTFSDAIRVNDAYDDMSSIISQATSITSSFKFNKSQYDKSVKSSNWVDDLRKYGLDVATVAIKDSKGMSPTIDDTGLTLKKWNDERNDYDPEQIKMIENMIVFTDSAFQDTSTMVVGKIPLGNDQYVWGINAQALVADILIGKYLHIENESGTYKFEDEGFTASNGINTVKISPSKDDELFSVFKDNDRLLYFDSNGNAHFKGILDAAEGHFAGLISGGSININDQFIVDNYGNMTAKSGTFSGFINGASIDIGNGYFKVDRETGFVTQNIGVHGGWWIGNGSIVGLGEYKFGHRLTELSDGTWELKIYEEGWESEDGLEKKIYAEKPNDYQIFEMKEKYMSQYNLRNSFQAFSSKNECALSIGYSPSSQEAVNSGYSDSTGWKTGRFVVFQSGKCKCKRMVVTDAVNGTDSGTTNSYIYAFGRNLDDMNRNSYVPTVSWVRGYVQNNISSSNITADTRQSSNGNGNYVQLGSATVATTGWCARTFAKDSDISSLSSRISSLSSRISALENQIK